MGVGVESSSYLARPLIRLRVVSIIFGCLGDWVLYPRELCMIYSNKWVIGWIFIGAIIAIARIIVDTSSHEDLVGSNNLCYIRAPYQLFTHRVLNSSLDYLKRVEQGWGEQCGPQGIKRFCSILAGKSVYFEW